MFERQQQPPSRDRMTWDQWALAALIALIIAIATLALYGGAR